MKATETIVVCRECKATLVKVRRYWVCPNGHGRLISQHEVERTESAAIKARLADLPLATKPPGPQGGNPKHWHVNGKRVRALAQVKAATAAKRAKGNHVAKIEGDWYLIYEEIEQ